MPDTVTSDRSESVPDDRRLRRARPWIPLALGVSAVVIGGILYSPQPTDDSGLQSRPTAVSASP
jgi:hypothetical protein